MRDHQVYIHHLSLFTVTRESIGLLHPGNILPTGFIGSGACKTVTMLADRIEQHRAHSTGSPFAFRTLGRIEPKSNANSIDRALAARPQIRKQTHNQRNETKVLHLNVGTKTPCTGTKSIFYVVCNRAPKE